MYNYDIKLFYFIGSAI